MVSGASWPTSTVQTHRWSESGWRSSFKILPMTTFLIPSASQVYPSTLLPLMVIFSAYSWGVVTMSA